MTLSQDTETSGPIKDFNCRGLMRKETINRQAEAFRNYASKHPDKDLLHVFNEWADSKDLHGVDKEEIWKVARSIRKPEIRVISDQEEEFIRLHAVLEIILEADLELVNKLVKEFRPK